MNSNLYILKKVSLSVLVGISFCVLIMLIVSPFAVKLSRFMDLISNSVTVLGAFLCGRVCAEGFCRNKVFWGFLSSVIMCLIIIVVSVIIWRQWPYVNSFIRILLMPLFGTLGAFGSKVSQGNAKRTKQY